MEEQYFSVNLCRLGEKGNECQLFYRRVTERSNEFCVEEAKQKDQERTKIWIKEKKEPWSFSLSEGTIVVEMKRASEKGDSYFERVYKTRPGLSLPFIANFYGLVRGKEQERKGRRAKRPGAVRYIRLSLLTCPDRLQSTLRKSSLNVSLSSR